MAVFICEIIIVASHASFHVKLSTFKIFLWKCLIHVTAFWGKKKYFKIQKSFPTAYFRINGTLKETLFWDTFWGTFHVLQHHLRQPKRLGCFLLCQCSAGNFWRAFFPMGFQLPCCKLLCLLHVSQNYLNSDDVFSSSSVFLLFLV